MDTEQTHVHDVYEEIAEHFSSTRYKPWPRVDQYLRSQPRGSLGCDVGGGNGKYLGYDHVCMIACDRSEGLTRIAATKAESTTDDAVRCDGLELCYRRDAFDFAISIAVVHHFATRERRTEAIKALLDVVTNTGTILVYVWALEQQKSRRGYHAGMDPDVLVPWVDNKNPERKFQRFYHLYENGELEQDIRGAGGRIVESGYEKDNWWCVASKS